MKAFTLADIRFAHERILIIKRIVIHQSEHVQPQPFYE